MADDVLSVSARTPYIPSTTTSSSRTAPTVAYAPRASGPTVVIPSVNWSLGTGTISMGEVLQQKLARTAKTASQTQLTCAALDATIPVVYGTQVIGALLANALTYSGKWVFWCIWCEGIIDSIVEVRMNDEVLPATFVHTPYTGTQTVKDSTLNSAFAAAGIWGFDQVCTGLAYSVITAPFSEITSPPSFTAKIKGQKIYDPRVPTTAWSDNPALIAADVITNTLWGGGLQVDWDSVHTCADANDTLVGSGANQQKQRTCNIIIDRVAFIDDWIETLRASASAFFVNNQGTIKFIADADGTASATYDHASGEIIELTDLTLRSTAALPTVMEVQYTDTSQIPWSTVSSDPVVRPGVDTGVLPYRKSVVQMPWVLTKSQAQREATERLNKLWLRSLTGRLHVFDKGLKHEPGDLISVTYPEAGLSAIPMHVLYNEATDKGWRLNIEKHDPAAYNYDTVAEPTVPNTNLPSPNDPPTITGLSVTEDVYQVQTGYYASRLRATWDDMRDVFPFCAGYWVTISLSGTVVQGPVVVPINEQTYVSPALKESQTYQVSVRLASVTAVMGDEATFNITNSGKSAKPSPPTNLYAFEVGGETRISWELGADLDPTATELRYGSTAGSWATATLLDRIATPSIRYNTKVIPAGTWRIYAKMLDSVRTADYPYGQESTDAAYVDVVVTSDRAAFIATDYDFTSPSLYHMTGTGPWITDFSDTWNSLFTSTLSSYGNALSTYHTSGTSGLITEVADAGLSLTGDWNIDISYSDVVPANPADLYIETCSGPEATVAISTTTNATPISVTTSAAHGYSTGDEVNISGVTGNTNANGRHLITYVDSTHFTLQDLFGVNTAGNGTHGGTATSARWQWARDKVRSIRTTAQYARVRLMTYTTGTLYVGDLGSLRVNVVARDEGGITTTVTGTDAKIVEFANPYSAIVNIALAASGTTAATPVYDMVEVSGGRGLRTGRCLYFPSLTAGYVDLGDKTAFKFSRTGTYTIECWAKHVMDTNPNALLNKLEWVANSKGWRLIFWDSSPGQGSGASGKIQWLVTDNQTVSDKILFSSRSYGDGQWHHIAAVYVGSGSPNMKLYVDGVLDASASITIPATDPDSVAPLTLGSHGVTAAYAGHIDDVRIWNDERTATEIANNMNVELVGNEANLVGYWKCDSNPLDDLTTNGNNGTFSGAQPPWLRPYDGMDVRAFNSAGSQVAIDVSWGISGV